MEKALYLINMAIAVSFAVCYAYQGIYLLVSLLKKPKRLPEGTPHRFAVLIAARNEEAVIGALIHSIRHQDYPQELVDIYTVADNCTDGTALAARQAGALVWERFDTSQVGKGYALRYLFQQIEKAYPQRKYDGYFIFDADNLLDEHYISEMNRTFSAGYRIVTSYRNSKNYGDSWISAGSSLWFLREARYLNQPRMTLGSNCAVSGTGFLIHREIAEQNGGWKHFLLTEDIEFTVDSILQGEKIGCCSEAVFYDEQPTSFSQSWRQRLRWTKGSLQVLRRYGVRLIRGIRSGSFSRRLSCFDMVMNTAPAALLTEWRRIPCTAGKKLWYLLFFPLFMYTYIPILAAALFQKVEWKPIRHDCTRTLEQLRQQNPKSRSAPASGSSERRFSEDRPSPFCR